MKWIVLHHYVIYVPQKTKNGRNEKNILAEVVLLVPINHPSLKKYPV